MPSFINGMRQAGIGRVDQLVTRAMLDPDVARVLLSKLPDGAAPVVVSGRMKMLMRALQVAGPVSAASQAPQARRPIPQSPRNALLTRVN